METVKWRFLDTGKGSAFFNMALDDAVVEAVSRNSSPPTFRLYEWEPNAITFGYNQNIDGSIDTERCKKDKVDITRRITGGRAVFHKNEIAYSVIGFIDDPYLGGNLMETYLSISRVLVEGFSKLGINTEINRARLEKGIPDANQRLLPCFLITSRFEITLDGKKLVGSAQRRFSKIFLQQGSIITGQGQEKIVDYMKNNEITSEYKKRLDDLSVDLKSKLNGHFSKKALKTSLFNTFKKTVDNRCVYENPKEEELNRAERLIEERYSSKGWIYRDV